MDDNPRQPAARPAPEVKPRITLVLADGHSMILEGLRSLLHAEPDLELLATCSTDQEALAAVGRHRPAVLVLELQLPTKGGLALLRQLSTERLSTRAVILTSYIGKVEMAEAMRYGVKGVVLKELPPQLLFQCVRQVTRGGMWFERTSAAGAVDLILQREAGMRDMRHVLTRRELEVLQLVAAGLRNGEIGTRLAITEGTVKLHLHKLYEKLGIKDRVQMALYARDNGMM